MIIKMFSTVYIVLFVLVYTQNMCATIQDRNFVFPSLQSHTQL